jgi:hypothetical protein
MIQIASLSIWSDAGFFVTKHKYLIVWIILNQSLLMTNGHKMKSALSHLRRMREGNVTEDEWGTLNNQKGAQCVVLCMRYNEKAYLVPHSAWVVKMGILLIVGWCTLMEKCCRAVRD